MCDLQFGDGVSQPPLECHRCHGTEAGRLLSPYYNTKLHCTGSMRVLSLNGWLSSRFRYLLMCAGGFSVRLGWFNRMHRSESEKIKSYWHILEGKAKGEFACDTWNFRCERTRAFCAGLELMEFFGSHGIIHSVLESFLQADISEAPSKINRCFSNALNLATWISIKHS